MKENHKDSHKQNSNAQSNAMEANNANAVADTNVQSPQAPVQSPETVTPQAPAGVNPFGNESVQQPVNNNAQMPQAAAFMAAPNTNAGMPGSQYQQYQGQPVMMMPVQPVDPGMEYRGLRGWLAFFMIAFGLNGLANIGLFIVYLGILVAGDADMSVVVSAIASPIVGVAMLLAAIQIAMRKASAKLVSQVAVVVTAVAVIATEIVNMTMQLGSTSSYSISYSYSYGHLDTSYVVISGLGAIVIQLITYGLTLLYFQKSRRVKATLVE